MTDISQIKKALENLQVLFIEDNSEFAIKEIRMLFESLCSNITCIKFDEIEKFSVRMNEKIDFIFLNMEYRKMEAIIRKIFKINANQTVVMLVKAQNVIYLEDEFQGNVMEFILHEDVSMQYIADMLYNVLIQNRLYRD